MNKISVLIADDEEFICMLLQKIILWDELNLEFIGFVHNGNDLYQEIIKKRPDIVITDIRMPQIDGIELIGRIRHENIPCRFIIVTGYRQFSYAHNALKYDVEDYILKPVDSKELNDTLRKLSLQIHPQDTFHRSAPFPSEYSNEIIKKLFLTKIIKELTPENSDMELLRSEYDIPFQPGYFQIIYIKSFVSGNFEDFLDTRDSVQEKLAQLFSQLLSPLCHVILYDKSSWELHIGINYNNSFIENIKAALTEFYEKAKNIVDLFKDYHITVGIGEPYQDICHWQTSALEAEYALRSSLINGTGQLVYWETEKKKQTAFYSPQNEEELFRKLHKAYETLDQTEFSQAAHALLAEFQNTFSSLEHKRISDKIENSFFEKCHTLIEKYLNESYLKKQIFFSTLQATTLPDYEYALISSIANAITELKEYVNKQNSKPVRDAVNYIENHYSENIGLEDVASAVGLTSAYLSNIFKNMTGKNYLEYLTEYRIEQAKFLLRTTNKSIKDIANAISYTDTHYFSKLFKKIVGIKPTDYRKIYG